MHLKCPEWEKILLLNFSLLKNWKPSVRWGCRRVHDDLYFPFSSPFILCLSRQAVWLCGCARCREPAASASSAAARCRGGRGAAAPPCVRAPLLPPSAPSRSPALPPPATAPLPSDPRSSAASWLLASAKPAPRLRVWGLLWGVNNERRHLEPLQMDQEVVSLIGRHYSFLPIVTAGSEAGQGMDSSWSGRWWIQQGRQ